MADGRSEWGGWLSPFRLMGILCFVNGCADALLWWMNREARAHGGHDLGSLWELSVASILLGVGLCAHRKWAAVLFSTVLALLGAVMAIGSIGKVPVPFLFINWLLAVVLILPAVITVLNWQLLRSRWIP